MGVVITKILGKFGGLFKWFSRNIKISFLFIFFSILLFNAVMLGVQAKDPIATLDYIGEKFISVTTELNDNSLELIERGSVHIQGSSLFSKLWAYISTYWIFFESFIVMYMWIRVLGKFVGQAVVQDSSKKIASTTIGIGLFILIQLIILQAGDKHILLDSFINFIKAIPILLTPVAGIVEMVT